MARLIYAVLALALAALVAGFVVRTSSVPLIVSIALSGLVAVLILYGHSRRLRQSGALGGPGETAEPDEPPIEVLDVVEVDEDDVTEFQRPAEGETADVTEVREPATRKVRPPRPTRTVPVRPTPSSGGETSARVTVIPGRSRFHTADCRFAKSDDARVVTETTARRRGYEPCGVCMPDAES